MQVFAWEFLCRVRKFAIVASMTIFGEEELTKVPRQVHTLTIGLSSAASLRLGPSFALVEALLEVLVMVAAIAVAMLLLPNWVVNPLLSHLVTFCFPLKLSILRMHLRLHLRR